MRLDYHDLSEDDFERLVIAICAEILGAGVSPFCKGPDGGRDARFEGTAEALPSAADPHKGRFIVQAKQTDSPIAKFSDPDFSSDAKSSVISKEVPAVKKLVESDELDFYLLFTNRKLSGIQEGPIRKRIAEEIGIEKNCVELFGIERIDMMLKLFPRALETFGQQQNSPLLVCAEDLAEVILSISINQNSFAEALKPDEIERVSFVDKNKANGLSAAYANWIGKKYLPYFDSVKRFLATPGNDEIIERYESAADEFEEQIALHREDYARFDDVLTRIISLLVKRDGDLRSRKRHTKLVVFYMYWNCDIGSEAVDDATT